MKAVGWILGQDCEIDAQDVNGFTALHLALFNGNLHLAKELLKHGCRVDVRSWGGWLPLHSLASCGHDLQMDRYQDIDFAFMINQLSLNGALLDSPGDLGLCAAHLTILAERPNFLESFVRAGANFILLDWASRTALDYLITRTKGLGFANKVYTWILGGKVVSEFQQAFAIAEGFVSDELLVGISTGEDTNENLSAPEVLLYSWDPGLDHVNDGFIKFRLFDRLACKMLLGMTLIYVTMRTEDSSKVRMVFRNREILGISIERFSAIALVSHVNNRLRSGFVPKELPSEVIGFSDLRMKWQVAKVLDVLYSQNIDLIKSKLEGSPTIAEIETFLAEYGTTILSLPFCFDDSLFSVTLMKLFLDCGADIDKQNHRGDTALANAVGVGRDAFELNRADNIDMVRYLVRRGANPEIKNKNGKTAIEYVRENGLDEFFAIIPGAERKSVNEHNKDTTEDAKHVIWDAFETEPSRGVAEDASETGDYDRVLSRIEDAAGTAQINSRPGSSVHRYEADDRMDEYD